MENKEFNFNLSNAGSTYYKKQAKLQEAIENTLKSSKEKVLREQQEEEQQAFEESMAAARFSHAAKYARINDRARLLESEINYNENASIIGMTEMVARVVEKGLLLDEAEFTKLDPNYKTEIREIISGFLKESEINSDIDNRDTLTLMEHVYNTLPDVKEGKSLNEAQISNLINANSNLDVDAAINNLSGNVGSKVASLMEKEQQRVQEINDEVEQAGAAAQGGNPDEIVAALLNGEITTDDVDAMAQSGEIDPESYEYIVNAYNEQAGEGEEQPEVEGEAAPEIAGAEGAGLTPKKQIQMTPDGTLNINIFEAAQPQDVEAEEATPTPRAQIQMNPDGTLVASDLNKQVVVGPEGEMQIDIMEAIDFAVKNYYEYEDYLQEGIVTDFDLGKWSPEMEIEKKYTQKGRVFGTILGWFFGGVIGAFLKVLFPGSGLVMKYLGASIAAAIKGAKANPFTTIEEAGAGAVTGAAVGGSIIGAAAGHYIGRKVNARINRKKIKALIEACAHDGACNNILNSMKTCIEQENSAELKKLREQFALRLDELKNQVTITFGMEKPNVRATSVYTEGLIKETPRSGLIESLAVNEARQMIKEGKEYNSDYCLAKAIMYVTITEAMNEMGLMNVDKEVYNNIISAAGGNISEFARIYNGGKVVKPGASAVEKFATANENEKKNAENLSNYKKDLKVKKSMNLEEGILVSQFVDPVNNKGIPGDDFAERIRQRKLMQEQQEVINE